jgi:glycerate-2-kinase
LKGDPTIAAKRIAQEILNNNYSGFNVLLLGGETTPVLPKDHGTGGRNQQFAISTLKEFSNYQGSWVLTAVSSDGSDFLADVAGAIVDNESIESCQQKGLDIRSYNENFDSNTILNKLGQSLVKTGYTNTNVGDLIVFILD